MSLIISQSQSQINILTDRTIFNQFKQIPENVDFKVCLYPFKEKNTINVQYLIIDRKRVNTQVQSDQIMFDESKFIKIHQQFIKSASSFQLITFIFKNHQINNLIKQQSGIIKLKQVKNVPQLNHKLESCIILSLKLPSQFFNNNQFNYHLQGFQFNARGMSTLSAGYIKNGKMNKVIFSNNSDAKLAKNIKQNVMYSKAQLNKVLIKIKAVLNANKNNLNQNQNYKLQIVEELSVLADNFYHSQKYLNNNQHFILPILSFQLTCLCSVTPTDKHMNKITNNTRNADKRLVNLCLDFSSTNTLSNNEQIIRQKLQELFFQESKLALQQNYFFQNQLFLSTMPTKVTNPHYFVKTQIKNNYLQYYIKGLYEYYHYGDHSFNDQGWGCAYRSLQTVLSWFILQKRLKLIAVPTINQIQKIIDLIDYNSASKISSTNNWIGATQVSWVIKKLTDCDCMILHIKDGKDILEHAQVFRNHLENVGTPIMYGGDEYAYTIVGINYDWKVGQIVFLILDPHYNGNDKIQKIIEKKGISWRKPEDMFKKGVFYNFCLPLL